jgi:hypothetical protein
MCDGSSHMWWCDAACQMQVGCGMEHGGSRAPGARVTPPPPPPRAFAYVRHLGLLGACDMNQVAALWLCHVACGKWHAACGVVPWRVMCDV